MNASTPLGTRTLTRPAARWLTTLALCLLSVPTVPAAADWDRFRGGAAQTGVASSPLAPVLAPAWSVRLDEEVETTAAIVDGVVYLATLDGTVVALSLADGKERWRTKVEDAVKSSPLVSGGIVYFGDEGGVVHALDAATGEAKFTARTGAAVTGAVNLGDGCLMAPSYDNSVHCFDPATGEARWSHETAGYVHGTPALASNATGPKGRASAARWAVGGCDGDLRLLAAGTGEATSVSPLGGYSAASPAAKDGRVYLGTFENQVMAVDAASGAILWRYQPTDREFPFYSSPAVDGKTVVVGGRDKRIHAIDAETGTARWLHTMRGRVDASPVIASSKASGGHVYVADQTGLLRALSLSDGSVLWEFEAGDGFLASPAVSAGRLVITTADGTVIAFAAPKS